eukprot:jgi/Chlat1/2761/Chrsp187S02940
MSSYDKVKPGGLKLKGGLSVSAGRVDKKNKKKRKNKDQDKEQDNNADAAQQQAGGGGDGLVDYGGTGHLPEGKGASKGYEQLFHVETKRFGYQLPPQAQTREDALDARQKLKADRYCK